MRNGVVRFWFSRGFAAAFFLWFLAGVVVHSPSARAATAQSEDVVIDLRVYGLDTTPPSAPTNLVPTLIVSVPQVVLTWASSTDDTEVIYYNIFRDALPLASSTLTTFTDASVAFGNTYRYTVSAVDVGHNESLRSATSSILVGGSGGTPPDNDPPTVPDNLAATVATDTPAVTLTWDPSLDARSAVDGYRVYRDGTQIADVATESYTDATIAYDTLYLYTVAAYDSEGNLSAQSPPLSLQVQKPADTQAPSVPTNVAVAVDGVVPFARLTWDPASDNNSGVAGYHIFRDSAFLSTVATTTFADFSVAFGATYAYTVAAFDGAGNESTSSTPILATIPPDATPPSVPFGVTAQADASIPAILVSWQAASDNAGVTDYLVYRNGTLLTTTGGIAYTDTGAVFGTTYSYEIAARDVAGNTSAKSPPATAKLVSGYVPPDDGATTPPPEEDTGGSGDTAVGGGAGTTSPATPEEGEAPAEEGSAAATAAAEEEEQTSAFPFVPQGVTDVTEAVQETFGELRKTIQRQIGAPASSTPEQKTRRRLISVGSAVTGVVAPAIEIAVLPAVAGVSFWYALLFRLRDFGQFIALLFPWLGLRNRRKPWGTVYDSVTKQPLDPAYVELLQADTGEEVASAITDLDGRYGFTAPPGRYVMRAQKTNYLFPSQRLAGKEEDAIYQNLYFGDVIDTREEQAREDEGEAAIIRDIPMDPEKFDWNEFEKRRLGVMRFYSRYDRALHYGTSVLFYGGFLFSVYATFAHPGWFNYLVLFLYFFIMAVRRLVVRPRAKGVIVDADTGAPLSFAALKVFVSGQDARPTKKVLADQLGRYYCLVRPGEYYVVIERLQPDGTYRPFFRSDHFRVKKGVIDLRWQV